MSPLEPTALVALLATALALWLFYRTVLRRKDEPDLPAGRTDAVYSPYMTQYDVECVGEDLAAILEASGNDISATSQIETPDPETRRSQFEAGYRSGAESLADQPQVPLDNTAILLLIDQSGSMAQRMPRIAGELQAAIEALEASGASVMLAGFTTVGWQGGKTCEKWSLAGRPEYPGRLCDLLHVTYSPFDRKISDTDMEPLLAPDVYFENVDGEALLWARGKLGEAQAQKRLLLILSDGAPVDDATYLANGDKLLASHLKSVIADLEGDSAIALGGIGIGYGVRDYYSVAKDVGVDASLAIPVWNLIAELTDLEPV